MAGLFFRVTSFTPNTLAFGTSLLLSLALPAKRAVENIDICVYPGEVVTVVGESGSGKATVGRTAVAFSNRRSIV
ncbi:ATP-binding cassette domain-containing protein [Phyllobacterium sp. SB3]|uniref:ATP-binding cassette domain-containing protein n=1 Tax=Phyllobacterium sp. SB3 TaxID=3156073 RepID=UPI0032AFFC76